MRFYVSFTDIHDNCNYFRFKNYFKKILLNLFLNNRATNMDVMSEKRIINSENRKNDNESISKFADINKPIEIFDRFLEKHGGHTGGWPMEDHASFIEYRKKHNLNNTVRLLQQKYPDINADTIKSHDNWYNKYIKLKCEQERAIKFWKVQKQSEKTDHKTIEVDEADKICNKYKKLQENIKIKSKIQLWKESKRAQKEKEEIEKKMYEREIKNIERQKQLRQKYKSDAIRKYKQDVTAVQNAVRVVEEIELKKIDRLKSSVANKMIRHFREKDEICLKKKQLQKLNISLETATETERILHLKNKLKTRIVSDPNRFLQPTKEWENKTKISVDRVDCTLEFKPFMNVDNVKRLAIPSWRKDVK